MLSGDNGILQRATDAKIRTEKATIIESAKTDILGQIAENKGADISDTQFTTILEKYFKEESIPNDFPVDLSTVELTTLDGKYKILASEIYDGTLKTLSPGLYYAGTDNLIMSWEELIDTSNAMINVNNGVLSRSAFSVDTQVKLIVDKSVTSVTSMGGISQLDEIKLPNTVTTINPSAFGGCNNLQTITILSGNIGSGAFAGDTSIKNVNLGNNVISIGADAFSGCTALKTVQIPDSVTTIGATAFKGCINLENVTIGSGGVSIDQNTFKDDTKLKTVEIKAGTIGAGTFFQRTNLETVKLGKDVNISSTSTFGKCTNLTNVELEEGLTVIGEYTFGECTNLNSVIIPNSVTSIGDRAFIQCPLNTIVVNSPSIGEEAFHYCSLTSVTIGPNVRSIGKKAFGDFKSEEVEIKEDAFANYTNHPNSFNISLPDSITTIEKQAFKDCEMTTIKIPKSVTSIANDTFRNCDTLENIILENGSSLSAPANKWGATNATVTQEQ